MSANFVGASEGFEAVFDFAKSTANALEVASDTPFKNGESVVLTTNAPPSIFQFGRDLANGVTLERINAAQSYFAIHQAGLAQGRDQYVVLITIAAGSKTLTLNNLYARCCGNNRLGFTSVFVTSKKDLSEATELGSYMADDNEHKLTFPSPVVIPPGMSKIFILRADMTNPDNTRYVLHRNMSIVGTAQDMDILRNASAVCLVVETEGLVASLLPKAGIVDGCFLPAKMAQAFSVGTFWTVQRSLDGAGYTLSVAADYMSFRQTDVTARGTAIALTTDVTKALVVVPQYNPLTQSFALCQVGSSLALTFQTIGGCIGSLQPLLATNDSAARMYQHWQFTTNNLQLFDGWTKIGSNVDTLVPALSDEIFAIERNTRHVLRFDGETWLSVVSKPVLRLVGHREGLYAIMATESDKVMKLSAVDGDWVQVGQDIRLTELCVEEDVVVGLNDIGDAFLLDGAMWRALHSPALAQLVVSGSRICGLSVDRSQVLLYNAPSAESAESAATQTAQEGCWTQIGGAMTRLLPGGNALYAVDTQGLLQRYNHDKDRDEADCAFWALVSLCAGSFAAQRNSVYRLCADADGVFALTGADWQRVCGSVDSVVIGMNFLFGLRGSEALCFCLHPAALDIVGSSERHRMLSSSAESVPWYKKLFRSNKPMAGETLERETADDVPWILTFYTLDEMFAGFDGQVYMKFVTAHKTANRRMEDVSFVRGGRDRRVFRLPNDMLDITCLELRTHNWWADQWHLSSVRAYCPQTNKQFDFSFKGKINLTSTRLPSRSTPTVVEKSYNFVNAKVMLSPYEPNLVHRYVSNVKIRVSNGCELYLGGNPSDREAYQRERVYEVPRDDYENFYSIHNLDYESIEESWWMAHADPHAIQQYGTPKSVYEALVIGGALERLSWDRRSYYASLEIMRRERERAWMTIDLVDLMRELAEVKL